MCPIREVKSSWSSGEKKPPAPMPHRSKPESPGAKSSPSRGDATSALGPSSLPPLPKR
jgi:hypothetical protein